MSYCKYYTCQELVDKGGAVKLLRWNAAKIGVFYNCLLLDGKTFGKHSRVIVTVTSFNALVEYAYNVLGFVETEPEYLSYDEVLNEIPQAELYRWSPTIIGHLYHAGLLQGKKSLKEGKNLVTRQSVINLIRFTGKRFNDIANKQNQ